MRTVRILIAPDKFKGCLTAREVAENIALGIRDARPDDIIETKPCADGGEGTADVIGHACGGQSITCAAHDALGRPVRVQYFWLSDRATAVMEMSAAAGLWRIAPGERDVLKADTLGVGEMMKDAAARGAKEILLGLGGSATNDGGLGMARSLGFRFLADDERELTTAVELIHLARIVPSKELGGRVVAAADVRNPLLGPRGATRTFGRQKGGTSGQLEILEQALAHLADIVSRDLHRDFRETAGAGAAGGLGFGLMSFCGATIRSGFEVVSEFVGLREAIANAEVVITGEGRLDEQTLEGKAPAGVARLARELGKPVFAIVGTCSGTSASDHLFHSVLPLAREGITIEDAMAKAPVLLQERARELAQMM